MIKKLALTLFLAGIYQSSFAQAYDGLGDRKIFAGYSNVGGKSGFGLQIDFGVGGLVSFGNSFTYLIKPDERQTSESFDENFKFFDGIDIGGYVRFHFNQPLQLNDNLDPYVGFDATIKSLGPHIGCKYNFTDTIGAYVQYSQSISSSYKGDHYTQGDEYDIFDDNINFFGKKSVISLGLTFNLYY